LRGNDAAFSFAFEPIEAVMPAKAGIQPIAFEIAETAKLTNCKRTNCKRTNCKG